MYLPWARTSNMMFILTGIRSKRPWPKAIKIVKTQHRPLEPKRSNIRITYVPKEPTQEELSASTTDWDDP